MKIFTCDHNHITRQLKYAVSAIAYQETLRTGGFRDKVVILDSLHYGTERVGSEGYANSLISQIRLVKYHYVHHCSDMNVSC